LSKLRKLFERIAREISFYRRVLAHPGTPWLSRILLGAALAYFVSPIDILPDVIPVVGQLDDLVIVPGLIYLALRLIPAEIIESCRAAEANSIDSLP
jgi:uncharacterized membrane protein YkvA (DUF1232 family)